MEGLADKKIKAVNVYGIKLALLSLEGNLFLGISKSKDEGGAFGLDGCFRDIF